MFSTFIMNSETAEGHKDLADLSNVKKSGFFVCFLHSEHRSVIFVPDFKS